MTSIVFVGPTLEPEEVAAAGDFICLPPVSQGDVYRAARSRPRAIGIIDGYFSGAPSVWHKEILWAISEGVPVFGSASMGALRAAELHSYGMRGVGRIFEAFRDGVLEDDDEVAVQHGPAEIGYLAASEPMVNIRETLALAETKGVLNPDSRRSLETLAKSLFSPSAIGRSCWRPRLRTASPRREVAALRDWLPTGRVDRKRLDALAMLARCRKRRRRTSPCARHFTSSGPFYGISSSLGPPTPRGFRRRRRGVFSMNCGSKGLTPTGGLKPRRFCEWSRRRRGSAGRALA